MFKRLAVPVVIVSLVGAACTAETTEQLDITCEGKCDGLSSVDSLLGDLAQLDVSDLVHQGMAWVPEGFDKGLAATDYLPLRIVPTTFYGKANSAANVVDIAALRSSVLAAFGAGSALDEVLRVRNQQTANGANVFAEMAFRIPAAATPPWMMSARGFGVSTDGELRVGLGGGVTLEGRVVARVPTAAAGLAENPLKALRTQRGFGFPRSLADHAALLPGEGYSIAGEGSLGINVGAGIPFLLASPLRFVGYNVVVSAAIRTVLKGQLDIAAVKLEDQQLLVELGLRNGATLASNIALSDGFGVTGLPERQVKIGGRKIDLGKLLEKALQTRVADKLHVVRAEVSGNDGKHRITATRLRFDLKRITAGSDGEVALSQALRGDVRLAQALSVRPDSGVTMDFDILRSGAGTGSAVGLELVGMRFFAERQQQSGETDVTTPAQHVALSWQSLHRERGWFFSSHGYTRTAAGGLLFDSKAAQALRGEANLFVSTVEGDKLLERDNAVDQIDALLLALAPAPAFIALEAACQQISETARTTCPPTFLGTLYDESCNKRILRNSPSFEALLDVALANFDNALPSDSPEAMRTLLRSLARLRIAAYAIVDPEVNLGGTKASLNVDLRFDDEALTTIFQRDRTAFTAAATQLIGAAQAPRDSLTPQATRAALAEQAQDQVRSIAESAQAHAQNYRALQAAERASLASVGPLGTNTMEVRFALKDGEPDLSTAKVRTLAQARAEEAAAMFDTLVQTGRHLDPHGDRSKLHPEQFAAFTLLLLANRAHIDVDVSLQADNEPCAVCPPLERYQLAGFVSTRAKVQTGLSAPLGGILFDLASLGYTE